MGVVKNGASVGDRPIIKSSSDGQRQGAIGHYAARIVAARIVAGQIESEEEAVTSFHNLVAGIDAGFYK